MRICHKQLLNSRKFLAVFYSLFPTTKYVSTHAYRTIDRFSCKSLSIAIFHHIYCVKHSNITIRLITDLISIHSYCIFSKMVLKNNGDGVYGFFTVPGDTLFTLAPDGMKESLAILKNCFPKGIPIIVTHHMHPAKTHTRPPSNPPNINQRILPIVLMTTHHPYPMFNILLQFPLLSHISL